MSAGPDITVAVVGLGFGRNHARVLKTVPGVRLAAVCDVDPRRLEAVAATGAPATYTDHREMLRREHPDAVIVAVPTRLHPAIAFDAIDAGCAVMVEKPLAPTLDEGRRIIARAEKAGVPLMHGHIERFNPAVQELARRLHAGEAGAIRQLGSRRLAVFIDRPRDFDVGVVHDLAFHDIDVMRFLCGAEVARVYAETLTNIRTPFEDALNGTLRFRGGEQGDGVIGTLEVNRLSARVVRELSVLGDRGEFVLDYREQSLEFRPSQALHADPSPGLEGPVLRLQGEDPAAPQQLAVKRQEPLLAELTAFIKAVRNSTPLPVSNQDALAALEVADALVTSGRTGQAVSL